MAIGVIGCLSPYNFSLSCDNKSQQYERSLRCTDSTVRLSTVTMRGRSCSTPLNNKEACSLSDVISWIPTADNDLCNHYHFQTEKTSNTQGQTLTHVCPVWTVVMSWLFLLGSHHSGKTKKIWDKLHEFWTFSFLWTFRPLVFGGVFFLSRKHTEKWKIHLRAQMSKWDTEAHADALWFHCKIIPFPERVCGCLWLCNCFTSAVLCPLLKGERSGKTTFHNVMFSPCSKNIFAGK